MKCRQAGGVDMEKKIADQFLYDFYGQLLTERQREVMRLYCEDDLSLSEIADIVHGSRQSVYDALRRAQHTLEGYEARLELVARYRRTEKLLRTLSRQISDVLKDDALSAPSRAVLTRALAELEELDEQV